MRIETLSDAELLELSTKWGFNIGAWWKKTCNDCKKAIKKAGHWVKDQGKKMAKEATKLVNQIKGEADK